MKPVCEESGQGADAAERRAQAEGRFRLQSGGPFSANLRESSTFGLVEPTYPPAPDSLSTSSKIQKSFRGWKSLPPRSLRHEYS